MDLEAGRCAVRQDKTAFKNDFKNHGDNGHGKDHHGKIFQRFTQGSQQHYQGHTPAHQ